MTTLTIPAWHQRVLYSLDALADSHMPFLLGLTRDSAMSSVLLYMDEARMLFTPEIAQALSDDDTPAFALLAFGSPVVIGHPLYNGEQVHGLAVVCCCIDDDDAVTVIHRPLAGWDILDSTDIGDMAHRIRARLWTLLLESAISHQEER